MTGGRRAAHQRKRIVVKTTTNKHHRCPRAEPKENHNKQQGSGRVGAKGELSAVHRLAPSTPLPNCNQFRKNYTYVC